ncbi:MAG: hypothetical protein KGL48_03730 [Sphingomonadales bacterium]|nr:hypothetical protein [Sphingomonadales bacterium]MDE2568009.1 hypothetical protein [Sphingomonadales bacterium]
MNEPEEAAKQEVSNQVSPAASRLTRWEDRLRRWGNQPLSAEGDPSQGAGFVFTTRARLALLAAFALLVMMRLPLAWVHGRFLDEEASIFLAYAWHRPAGEALWHSFGGYLNLGATASTLLLERLVRWGIWPLELAPYLTMTIALLFQLVPAALILFGRARFLANRLAVIAALLILATSPMTEEVFFNVLHIQFHLALAAALVLALEPPTSTAGRLGCWAILFFAPLCGPAAIVLLPFFALRCWLEQDRARLVQTAVLIAGASVQLLVFFTPSPVRGGFVDPATLSAILFERLVAMPVFGAGLANFLGTMTYSNYGKGGFIWLIDVVAAIACLGALVIAALRKRSDAASWLIVPGLAIAVVSFGGGMLVSRNADWFSVGAGERYNFLPVVLLGLGLIALTVREGRKWRVWYNLCLLSLLSGAITFAFPVKEVARGPAWSDEVAKWHRNHSHVLVVWPSVWAADLSDNNLPCHQPKIGPVGWTDPSYCESFWLMRVGGADIWARQHARRTD